MRLITEMIRVGCKKINPKRDKIQYNNKFMNMILVEVYT